MGYRRLCYPLPLEDGTIPEGDFYWRDVGAEVWEYVDYSVRFLSTLFSLFAFHCCFAVHTDSY
jgi:hypothetical protein